MKKLPKIYQAEFNKKISNNKKTCYVELQDSKQELTKGDLNVNEILDDIFSGIGYSYNIPIIIETKNKTYNTSLIAKTKNNVITLENEVIPISEIINIKKEKNS